MILVATGSSKANETGATQTETTDFASVELDDVEFVRQGKPPAPASSYQVGYWFGVRPEPLGRHYFSG
jgi:hypothetical protein